MTKGRTRKGMGKKKKIPNYVPEALPHRILQERNWEFFIWANFWQFLDGFLERYGDIGPRVLCKPWETTMPENLNLERIHLMCMFMHFALHRYALN